MKTTRRRRRPQPAHEQLLLPLPPELAGYPCADVQREVARTHPTDKPAADVQSPSPHGNAAHAPAAGSSSSSDPTSSVPAGGPTASMLEHPIDPRPPDGFRENSENDSTDSPSPRPTDRQHGLPFQPTSPSSRAAAASMVDVAPGQERRIYDYLATHPGRTRQQVALALKIEEKSATPRITAMRDRGVIIERPGGKTRSGRTAMLLFIDVAKQGA